MHTLNMNGALMNPQAARLLLNQLVMTNRGPIDHAQYKFFADKDVLSQWDHSGLVASMAKPKPTIGGIAIETSESVPKGELLLVRNNEVVAKIVNIGETHA